MGIWMDLLEVSGIDLSILLVVFSVLLLFLFLGVYYFLFVSRKISVHGSNKGQLEFLKGVNILKERYYPTPFYINGLAQTIFGITKRTQVRAKYEREIFKLADGGEIALDFKLQDSTDTLVIILPGYTSASQTSYVRTLVMACEDAGVSAVVMNNRGLGGVPLKTPKCFCATDCSDLSEVIDYLHEKFPEKRKIALGASFGGVLLSHFLIKCQEQASRTLECALLVCIVWNANIAADSLERPIVKQLINYPLLNSAKFYITKHKKVLEPTWNVEDILKRSRTSRQFERNFTAPQFGYKDIHHYYDDATISTKIHHFSIPVFGLSAADDPFQPGHTLPVDEAEEEGSNLVLLVTARGGHLGYLEGIFPTKRRLHFMDRFVKDFLNQFQRNWSLQRLRAERK